jgi:hypothetical protein
MNELNAALEAYKPELAARYETLIRWQFGKMVQDLGPKLPNVGNDGRWARVWYNTMTFLVTRSDDQGRRLEAAILDEARLARVAAEYANDVVVSWEQKIAAKLGELESAQIKNMGDMQFYITGIKHGHRVTIEQTVILKTSPKGVLFNQFPARIYLNGKFTSEAAFKRLRPNTPGGLCPPSPF